MDWMKSAQDHLPKRTDANGFRILLRVVGLCLVGVMDLSLAAGSESLDFFEKQVRPLLVRRCYSCHSQAKAGGGLSLDTAAGWKKGGESGPAITAGEPENSLLIDAINYRSLEMPPADKGGKLSPAEIAILTKWVSLGADDPRNANRRIGGMNREVAATWWAFQALPAGMADPGIANPTAAHIDSLLQREFKRQGLTPGPPADKRTLIRRATYDLTGLPPSLDDVKAYLQDDSDDAFDELLDRLLESPQYGARWGRHWLDVVRYADTAGENTDRPLPHAWKYRNWVIKAFNRDLPFDQFVRLQICGDIVAAKAGHEQREAGVIATGYLATARRFGHDIDKDIHLTHEDVIDNLGKNFLGLSLGCARCHDHKYDPVTSEDYYALYGVFASTRFAFPGCEAKGQPRDLVPLIEKSQVDALMAEHQERLARYEQQSQRAVKERQRLKQLAAKTSRLLNESNVDEGQSVSLTRGREDAFDRLVLRKGEVLRLVVLPNQNHGADTTRVELQITKLGSEPEQWDVADLIPKFTAGGPAIADKEATWCLLDVTDGPEFLHEKKVGLHGKAGLNAWAIGDTPSSVVNASKDAASVWTTLPGESFFVHPGVNRNVAIAWVCPRDGTYRVQGVVTDAHPAALDGVSFRFEHLASAEYGASLAALGKRVIAEKLPRPEPPVIPLAYAVNETGAQNARMHLRGDPEQLGDEIPRHWLSVFGGDSLVTNGGSGRRELAERIVETPLLARVMVNRCWQWHFGRGLVATPNDFGARGEAPTHPELLDWLAAQFRANGYRLKPLHRLIMNSAAYQRSSSLEQSIIDQDPNNLWLARFSRRRLSAEEIRDSLLSVSGRLDLTMGQAHPFPPEAGWSFTQHNPFAAVYKTDRRSVFLMVQRQHRHPFLALFDGADPNSSTAIRQSTTVPTQALYFLNDPLFHDEAAVFAARTEDQLGEVERVRELFRHLFQRDPAPAETETARRFLANYPGDASQKWAAYARVLLASNEFLYVD